MSTSDDIKSDLQKARDEVKRAFTEARGSGKMTQEQMQQRLADARSKRDSLRAKLHQDIEARTQSLESERERLTTNARSEAGDARAAAGERLRDVEKKIDVTRTELVADAETTLGEVDDEIQLLESRARSGDAAAAQSSDKALNDLRVRRERLREKARALRDAAGERFRQARLEYEEEVAYLTERRNEGLTGIN